MAENLQHEDFGEKIGGAKKDLWKDRGLYVDDLGAMNEREAEKFVKKDNVWKKPDYQSRRRQINELMPEHGTPKSMQYAPESERELAVILRRERLKRDYHAKPGNVQEYMEKLKKASMRGRLKEAQAAVAAPGRGAPHKGGLDR